MCVRSVGLTDIWSSMHISQALSPFCPPPIDWSIPFPRSTRVSLLQQHRSHPAPAYTRGDHEHLYLRSFLSPSTPLQICPNSLPFGSLKICTDADHLLPLETSFSPAATTSVALAHHPVNAWTASMMPWTSGSPLPQVPYLHSYQ